MTNETSLAQLAGSLDNASELKKRKQWVCWKYVHDGKGKPRKVPIQPDNVDGSYLKWGNPGNWLTHEEACFYYERSDKIDGIGFIVTEDDLYCFLDLDDYSAAETGEIPVWIDTITQLASSYSYFTPNFGVRIIGKGSLKMSGGEYVWTDPSTGEEHQLEAYDQKRMLTFTDQTLHELPIVDIQFILDSLVKVGNGSSHNKNFLNAKVLDTTPLSAQLEEKKKFAQDLLIKNGFYPSPIQEGGRRNFLLSVLSTVHHAGCPRGDLEELAISINETLFYSEDGHLEGLPDKEILELCDYAEKVRAGRASEEVLMLLGEMDSYLNLLKPYIRRTRDSAWKIMKGLIEQASKFGHLTDTGIMFNCAWTTLESKSKIKTDATINKFVKSLHNAGLIDYTSYYKQLRGNRKSSIFVLDYYSFNPRTYGSYFGLDNDVATNLFEYRMCNTPYVKYSSSKHVFWRNSLGDAVIKVVLALKELGGEAKTGEIALHMGRVDENGKGKSGNISDLIKRLCEWGVLNKVSHGRYSLAEDYEEKLFKACESRGEFSTTRDFDRKNGRRRKGFHEPTNTQMEENDSIGAEGNSLPLEDDDKVLEAILEELESDNHK